MSVSIAIKGFAKEFQTAGGQPLRVLENVDLAVAAGEFVTILGPSGCGKSTLLNALSGLDTGFEGTVEIGRSAVGDAKPRIAYLFQEPRLLPWRTVRGNIALALTLARRTPDPEEVDRLIALVGLAGFEDRKPAELSGGMRSRVAIARCLATRPGLLLLDEPFAAVDELTRLRLNEDLPRLWQARGTTTLLVTHAISEAVLLADRVVVFSSRPGRVVDDIAIPLPHPRHRDLTRDASFRDLMDSVQAALWAGTAPDQPLAAE